MHTFIRHFLTLLICSLFVLGCSHPTSRAPANGTATRLREAEVVRIAAKVAQRHGYRLPDYKEPRAHYEFVHKDKNWTVFYDGKVPLPGHHFMVWVDDRTGEARVMPGE